MTSSKKRRNDRDSLVEQFRGATQTMRAALTDKVLFFDKSNCYNAPLSWWKKRWSDPAIRALFLESFIYVRDAFDENKIVRFTLREATRELHYSDAKSKAIVKCRRLGISTYFLAAWLADAIVLGGQHFRPIPHDVDAEEEFQDILKTMFENLPAHHKPRTKYYSRKRIHFHDSEKQVFDSKIITMTVPRGKEAKGRSLAITRLLLSEVPFWQCDWRKASRALLAASAGGHRAVESSPNGTDWLYLLYIQAKRKMNGWTAFFFTWWYHSEYKETGARFHGDGKFVYLLRWREDVPKWNAQDFDASAAAKFMSAAHLTKRERVTAILIFRWLRKKGYVSGTDWRIPEVAERIAWRRTKIAQDFEGDEAAFLIEYPESDDECFKQSGRAVIPERYRKITCSPAEPIEGRRYVISADTSLGVAGGNPSAVSVIDEFTGRQVKAYKKLIKPDLLGRELCDLSDEYNGALILVERNNTGIGTIQEIQNLGYEDRLFKQISVADKRAIEDGRKTSEEAVQDSQFGLQTSSRNKGLMGQALEYLIRKGEFGISSQELIDEALNVVWLNDGGFAALEGFEDDMFMACAIYAYWRRYEVGWNANGLEVLPETGLAR